VFSRNNHWHREKNKTDFFQLSSDSPAYHPKMANNSVLKEICDMLDTYTGRDKVSFKSRKRLSWFCQRITLSLFCLAMLIFFIEKPAFHSTLKMQNKS
jgi:hypothetical protein